MATLYISHMNVTTDHLNRFVTTLTQEILAKINEHEERIFIDTLCEIDRMDDDGEIIQYHNEDYTEIDVFGDAVKKAIDTVNSVAKHTLLAPITEIHENELYRIEFEH